MADTNPQSQQTQFEEALAYQRSHNGESTPEWSGLQNELMGLQKKMGLAGGGTMAGISNGANKVGGEWKGSKGGGYVGGTYSGLTPEETAKFDELYPTINGQHKSWLAKSGIVPALALTAITAGTASGLGGAFAPAVAGASSLPAGATAVEGLPWLGSGGGAGSFSLSGIGDAISSAIPSKASIMSHLGLDGSSGIGQMLGLGGDAVPSGMGLPDSNLLGLGDVATSAAKGRSTFDKLGDVMGIINAFHGVPGMTSQQDIQDNRAADAAKAAEYSRNMINGMNTATLDRSATPYTGDYSTYGEHPMTRFYDEANPRMTF